MRALAGPAMMLVMAVGFVVYRMSASEDAPSREFLDLEFAGADTDSTGSCYSLSTVLIASRPLDSATRSWTSPRDDAWTLTIEDIVQGYGGPVRVFQKLTFEKHGEQARLVAVDASKDIPTDLAQNIDALLDAPNKRRSTPVDRCLAPGSAGYLFVPRR